MNQPDDPARRLALELVCQVTEKHRTLAEAEPEVLASAAPEVRARAARLAAETLRWADRADRMLGPYLRQKPPDLVLNLLRLGTVEMCQLDAPPHGVVNAMVALAEQRHRALANAVLRRIATGRAGWPELPLPRLPKWLRKQMVAAHGKETTAAIEAAHARRAPVDLTCKGDPKDWADRLGGRVLPTGSVRLGAPVEISALEGYSDGHWWVQDAAAALPAALLAAQPGERVLDICAAPGGKTLQLAATGARVMALDISDRRSERIAENLARTRLTAEIVVADVLEFEPGQFDAVLLDAPCSATGTIRRHPDLPYAKEGSDLAALIELQARMIDRAVALTRPGGRLVFSTCSLLPAEGEEQIAAALAQHPSLTLVPTRLPGVPAEWSSSLGLRTRPDYWPDFGGLDGFFVALLAKG